MNLLKPRKPNLEVEVIFSSIEGALSLWCRFWHPLNQSAMQYNGKKEEVINSISRHSKLHIEHKKMI